MSNLLKKLTLSFLSFLILFFSVAPGLSVYAQETSSTWYNQGFFDWYAKVYDTNNSNEIFGERYTAAQVQWVAWGAISLILNIAGASDILSCVLSNSVDLTSCAGAVKKMFTFSGIDPSSNIAQNNQGKSLLSLVFADRPLSGIGYVKNKIQNFSLVPVAHAQVVGFGYTALKPIQDMWAATRNIAFGFFVLAAVIFAFMIMFRVKISPQVVISVQSALPKLVLALILVTFSYAIAGFLIDLMYVVIGLLSVMLASFTPITGSWGPRAVFNILTMGQPLGGIQISIVGFLAILTAPLWILLLIFVVVLIVAAIASGGVGIIFWIMFIPLIMVALIIIWICIKTVWALFKAFAYVILLTIFAPLQIALGVLIPNFGFGQWVKSYLSYLSVFVTTGVIGYLSILFTLEGAYIGLKNIPGGETITAQILSPFIGTIAITSPNIIPTSPWPPLLGAGSGVWVGILFLGVSFVLFTMIPKATEIIQGFISGKPFAYGTAIGEAFGPVKMGWGMTGGAVLENVRRGQGAGPIQNASNAINQQLNKIYEAVTTGTQNKPGGGKA